MIDDQSRKDLILYRVQQARITSREARVLIENDLLRGSMNRMYYSMFYMLQALSLKHQFESSKHTQLIGWFNKNFIHTGLIEVKFSKIITKAYNLRTKGDYATVFVPEKEEILKMFEEMEDFNQRIVTFLEETGY
ncbi:MAG: HEPN domain-containing protein [Lentimicrobium sp.]